MYPSSEVLIELYIDQILFFFLNENYPIEEDNSFFNLLFIVDHRKSQYIND